MKKIMPIILTLLLLSTVAFAAEPKADKLRTDTADFGGNLSATDTTVQKALDTIDDMTVASTWGSITGTLSSQTDLTSYLSTNYEPKKGADDNFVTDAEKTVIGNTSGTNTGDQDLSGYYNSLNDLKTAVTNDFHNLGGTDADTTYSAGNGLSLSSTTFSVKLNGSTLTNGTDGLSVTTPLTLDNMKSAVTNDFHNLGGTDATDDSVSGSELDGVFSSNGLLKRTGTATYTVDTNSYLTDYVIDGTHLDSVFTSSGLLKRTGAGTYSVDTSTYLTVESDPVYVASSWPSTTNNATNWDTAYGWGDHSSQGYFDTDTDTLDDIPDGTTYKLLTATKDGYIDQDVTSGATPTFTGTNFTGIPAATALTGAVPIANGGSGQATQQDAINALTAVSSATNESVLTKDTATGNAIFKTPAIAYDDIGAPDANGSISFGGYTSTWNVGADLASGNFFTIAGAAAGELTASSGTQSFLSLTPTINQSGTAGYTGLSLNVTETGTGSGTKNLIHLQVGGTSKYRVDNSGNVTSSCTQTDYVYMGAVSNPAYGCVSFNGTNNISTLAGILGNGETENIWINSGTGGKVYIRDAGTDVVEVEASAVTITGTLAVTSTSTFANVVMGDAKTVALDNAPDSDHTATGEITADTVGEAVAIGDVLYMKSDGKYWIADADASTTMPAMVMAIATISADASGNLLHQGYVRDDTWNWTVGGLIYVTTTGTTGNSLTQTAPTGSGDQVQVVGYAVTADIMFFNPSMVLVEHA